jgi:biotin carboxyl carrier protein
MTKLAITLEGHTFNVELNLLPPSGDTFTVQIGGQSVNVVVPNHTAPADEMDLIVVDGRPYEITVDRELRWIKAPAGLHRLEVRDLEAAVARPLSGDGRVKAPIPGQISRIHVRVGQAVEVGTPLMILEAMKMENEIRAPRAGVVSALHVAAPQGVLLGQVLAEIG